MHGRSRRWILIWLAPYAIVFATLIAYPIFRTFELSLSEVSLRDFELQFIGLRNFQELLANPIFSKVLGNTALWVLGSVVSQLLLGMGAALLVNRPLPGKTFFRVLIFLPWAIPSIATANLWAWILHGDYGLLNSALVSMGREQWTTVWLANPDTAMPMLLLANLWSRFPLVSLLILAGLQGIPPHLEEAARIDGAGRVKAFWYVTLPLLRKTILLVIFLLLVFSIDTFDLIFATTGGGPGRATEVIGVHIYRMAFASYEFDLAAAAGVMVFLVTTFIAYWYIKLVQREQP